MDPLRQIPHDVHHLMFQHLDSKEIIELSTVSSEWYQAIGNNTSCMKRIRFSLKLWKNSDGTKQQQVDEKIKIMQNTSRRYHNIAIDCRFDRNLSIEFWKFLEFCSSAVRELKIKSIKLEQPTSIALPNLEVLRLTYVPTSIRNMLLMSSSSLVKLKLKLESPLKWNETSTLRTESLTCIRNCLERNQKLQELELHGSIQYRSFFNESFCEIIRFQLHSLKIKSGMRLALISELHEKNLVDFLATQSNSLRSFFIDVCRQSVIQFAFNKLHALTSLHIDAMIMDEFRFKDLNLLLNEHITDLKIPYANHHEDIKELISVTPNLISLFVAHLSHETMESIARNLKNLTTLKFRYDEIDCEDFYERLRDNLPEVNQNIEMIVDYDYS